MAFLNLNKKFDKGIKFNKAERYNENI